MAGHRRDHEWLETFEGTGADRYDEHSRWLRGMHRRTAERVAALLPPGGRLVDVGCGPGRLLADVATRRPDATVTGVDRSARMVELAAARLASLGGDATSVAPDRVAAAPLVGDRRVLLGDVAALPLPDSSADLVAAVLTAHHWEDLRRGFDEVARVLAPGGTVLVVEMRGPARHVAAALGATLDGSAASPSPDLSAAPDLPPPSSSPGGVTVARRTAWVAGLPLLVRLEAAEEPRPRG